MVALAAPAVEVHFPVGGDLALRTGDRSRLPVNVKGREIVARGLLGLPTDVVAQWANEVDLMLAPARCEQTGVHVSGVNEMSGGSRSRFASAAWMGAVTSKSVTGAAVVRTLTMIWGSSRSHVSDRCAL